MQCSCGGQTKPGRAERSKQAAVLEFQACHTCGRVHFDALRLEGRLVSVGLEAQRAFHALDDGMAQAQAPVPPADPPRQAAQWFDALEHQPPQDALICVEYLTGGNYIAHGHFFDRVWDLIGRWRRHDNSQALREAREHQYPPGLTTPDGVLQPDKPTARPALPRVPEPPPPVQDLPPVGGNFSFAF